MRDVQVKLWRDPTLMDGTCRARDDGLFHSRNGIYVRQLQKGIVAKGGSNPKWATNFHQIILHQNHQNHL